MLRYACESIDPPARKATNGFLAVMTDDVDAEAARVTYLGPLVEVFAGQKRISGGSSERDVTEFAAMPLGPSAVAEVITVTPVGRCPSTLRKSSNMGTPTYTHAARVHPACVSSSKRCAPG
jgi:hypothetical protein